MLLNLKHDMISIINSCLLYGNEGSSCSKVCFVSEEDGGQVFTGVSFLAIFSKQLYCILDDVQDKDEITKVIIPVSSNVIENLLVLLSTGSISCDSIDDVLCVGKMASLLGIDAVDDWVIDSRLSEGQLEAFSSKKWTDFLSVAKEVFIFEDLLSNSSTRAQLIGGKNVFKCDAFGCGKFYTLEGGLIVHKTLKHFAHSSEATQINEDQCPICKQQFCKSYLHIHLQQHLPRKCSKCASIFYDQKEMASHMQSKHNKFEAQFDDVSISVAVGDENTYTCDKCQMVYTSQGRLVVHKVVRHFATSAAAAQIIKRQCPVCKGRFSKHYLALHLLKHLHPGSRQSFPCNICKTSFSLKASLIHHKKNMHNSVD